MELTFRQARTLGKEKFKRENNYNPYYFIPLICLTIVFVVSFIFVMVIDEPQEYTYNLPQDAEVLIVKNNGYYVGDTKLIMKENAPSIPIEYHFSLGLVVYSIMGMYLVFSIYGNKADNYADDYAIYYLQTKNLKE